MKRWAGLATITAAAIHDRTSCCPERSPTSTESHVGHCTTRKASYEVKTGCCCRQHTVQSLQFRQQSGQRNPEAACNEFQVDQTHVSVPAFNIRDVAPIQPQFLSVDDLRPTVL